ncbi:hypothetical protein [Candidatus Viridilinea mediisalina]|uniref:hypothetical protein n=1 Tax=Candidatus Viridilinea mediisalina TaxID=2024553 RepID=UPI0013FD74CA|nr:hypothetical protein [Candidatus Viridilinea mediisalina]
MRRPLHTQNHTMTSLAGSSVCLLVVMTLLMVASLVGDLIARLWAEMQPLLILFGAA